MSIAEHFQHAPDAGFVRNYDGASARRQFRMSMVLVAVIALATAALAFAVTFDVPTAAGTNVSMSAISPPTYAGKL